MHGPLGIFHSPVGAKQRSLERITSLYVDYLLVFSEYYAGRLWCSINICMKKNIPDLSAGERQMKPTVKKISQDHTIRYNFVLNYVNDMSVLLDIGCGVGYGSWILSRGCGHVYAYDKSAEARLYWRQHYRAKNITFIQADLQGYRFMEDANLAVCFEFLEHIGHPEVLLRDLSKRAARIFLSVPNEAVNPFDPQKYPYHKRHYTVDQLDSLLKDSGWTLLNVWSQRSKQEPDIVDTEEGKTLIAEAISI